MNFSHSNDEFDSLRRYVAAHTKKLNMGQLQNVVSYLMGKCYENEVDAVSLENNQLKAQAKEMREWLGGALGRMQKEGICCDALAEYLGRVP